MSWKVLEEIRTGALGTFTEISGNYAIASDPSFTNGVADDGQVRIYERKSNGNWTEVYLKNGDANQAAAFGQSIDISGNYAVVGEYEYGNQTDPFNSYGRARFYERKNGVWEEIQIISSPQGTGDAIQFGSDVAISGNLAAIGAPRSNTDAGIVYWYRRNVDNGQWEQIGEPVIGNWESVEGTRGGGLFGTNIKMDGNYAIVGEYGYGNTSQSQAGNGRAYWFEYTNGSWKQVFFDDGKVDSMTFGWGVGIKGNYAIVGAPGVDGFGANDNPGYAYIYERKYDGEWQLIKSLEGENNLDLFGEFVSISGSYAMVGASNFDAGEGFGAGKIYFYQRKKEGNWEQTDTNDGPAGGGSLGYGVSVDGSYAIGGGQTAVLRFYQKSV